MRANATGRRALRLGTTAVVLTLALGLNSAACHVGATGARTHRPLAHPPASSLPSAPPTPFSSASAVPTSTWRVAWGSTMGWGYGEAQDTTLRLITPVAIGGTAVRVRISNRYGNAPLVIGAATVGTTALGAALDPAGPLPLTFSGAGGTAIAPGASVYTDPLPLRVSAGQRLAVSLFVAGRDLMTVHPCCAGPVASYFTGNGAGNLTATIGPAGFVYASPWTRLVDAVDVLSSAPGSIVVVGDSITDGYNSTTRWTDLLQERVDLLPEAQRRAVVNEALTANTLTAVPGDDEAKGGGPPGVDRLAPDALDQAGVTDIVVLLGINDLWFRAPPAQVIAGLTQAAVMAHAVGDRIYVIPLLPRRTGPELWTPAQQAALVRVDDWVLASGSFDGVMDLNPDVADVFDGACDPEALWPGFDSGDHLHPNAAGDRAMANAFDFSLLGLPAPPHLAVPPLRPTPGCGTTGPAHPPRIS